MTINKHIPLVGAVLLAAVTLGNVLIAGAPPEAGRPAAEAPAPRPYPFRGTIAAVDTEARTLTLESRTTPRVLQLDAESILEKDGKTASIGEVHAGDYLRGRVRKNADGRETIVKAVAGPRPSKEAASVPTTRPPSGS